MAKIKGTKSVAPTKLQAEEFDMLSPLLDALCVETKELSKKKQDGVLNLLKVKMINKILLRIKTILEHDSSVEYLELLDEESLPTNSDASFMLSQFQAAMTQFRKKHYGYQSFSGTYEWTTLD